MSQMWQEFLSTQLARVLERLQELLYVIVYYIIHADIVSNSEVEIMNRRFGVRKQAISPGS